MKSLEGSSFTNPLLDREEALRDDFQHEAGVYDDDDDEDWAGDDNEWNDETEVDDEADGKDESSAYLEFLNDEVSFQLNYIEEDTEKL